MIFSTDLRNPGRRPDPYGVVGKPPPHGFIAQTVRLNTEPEGADIYVNNIFVGKSPTHYRTRTRTGTPDTAYIRVEKPGYERVRNATIDKTYRADISLLWLLPGIIPYFIAGAQYTVRRRLSLSFEAEVDERVGSNRVSGPRVT